MLVGTTGASSKYPGQIDGVLTMIAGVQKSSANLDGKIGEKKRSGGWGVEHNEQTRRSHEMDEKRIELNRRRRRKDKTSQIQTQKLLPHGRRRGEGNGNTCGGDTKDRYAHSRIRLEHHHLLLTSFWICFAVDPDIFPQATSRI